MKNKLLILLCILVFSATPAAAQWQSVEAPRGLGTKWLAKANNADGHELIIWRKIGRSGYEAYVQLTLGKGEKFHDEMPTFQIDNGKIEDTLVIKLAGENLGQRWGFIEGNKATWRIWTATTPVIATNDDLAPWIKGNRVKISYLNDKNQAKKAMFSLKGSGKAIKTAITGPFQ